MTQLLLLLGWNRTRFKGRLHLHTHSHHNMNKKNEFNLSTWPSLRSSRPFVSVFQQRTRLKNLISPCVFHAQVHWSEWRSGIFWSHGRRKNMMVGSLSVVWNETSTSAHLKSFDSFSLTRNSLSRCRCRNVFSYATRFLCLQFFFSFLPTFVHVSSDVGEKEGINVWVGVGGETRNHRKSNTSNMNFSVFFLSLVS